MADNKRIEIILDGNPEKANKASESVAAGLDRVTAAQEKLTQTSSRHQAAADKVIDGLQQQSTAADKAESSLLKMVSSLASATAAAALVGAGIAALVVTTHSLSVQAARTADEIDAKLNAVLASTRVQTGYTREGLDQLADSLTELSKFDDEGFKDATATILRFGEITGERLERTLKVSADLASFMGSDLPSAAGTLARSIAAPAQGIERLQRSIGYLDEAEIKNIKTMEEMGEKALAQEKILAILESRIGGTAAAINQGYTKAIEDAKKAQDNFYESLGKVSVIKDTTISFWNFVTQSFKDLKNIIEQGDWVEKALRVAAFAGGWRGVGNQDAAAPTVDPAAVAEQRQKEEIERLKKHKDAMAEQEERGNQHLIEKAKKYREDLIKEIKQLNEKDLESRKAYYDALEDQAVKEGQIALRIQREQNKEEARLLAEHQANELKAYQAQTDAIAEEYIRRGQQANKDRLALIKQEQTIWNDVADRGAYFFQDLLLNGKDAFGRLKDMVKDFAAELIAVFAKRWILNMASNIPGLGHLGQLAGTVGQGTSAGGILDSLGLSGGSMTGFGTAAVAGGAFGAIGTRALGAGQRGQQVGTLSAAALSTIGMAVGGPIGAAVGAVIGTAIGYFTDPDGLAQRTARVGTNPSGQYSYSATSAFGTFGTFDDRWFSDEDMGEQMRQFFAQQAEIENALARIMTADQRAAASAGLAGARDYGFGIEHGDVQGLTEIRRDRLAVIVDSLLPGLGDLVREFEGTSDELVKMIDSLILLRDFSADIESILAGIDGDALASFTRELDALVESVDVAETRFAQALEGRDPAEILASAQQLQQAVVNRYQTELDWIDQIQTGLQALKEDAYQFSLSMAERMNRVGGNVNVGAISLARFSEIRAGYNATGSAGSRLTDINNFLGAVDHWIQAETDRLNRENAAQQQAAAAIAAAQEAANRSAIEALQKQLELANQWQGVLSSVEQQIDRMRLTGSNPLHGLGRYGLASDDVNSLYSQFQSASGQERIDVAQRLMQAIQTRTGLREETMQRPSNEFALSFNEDMRILSEIRGVAKTEAEKQTDLQAKISALQERANSYSAGIASSSAASSAALDSIYAQAREEYAWAQREYEIANREQQDLLAQQLEAITGGMQVDLYIAQRQNDIHQVLQSIDTRIAAFLSGASTGSGAGTGGSGGGSDVVGGGGGGGGGSDTIVQIPVTLDGRQVGLAVAKIVDNRLVAGATALKRAQAVS